MDISPILKLETQPAHTAIIAFQVDKLPTQYPITTKDQQREQQKYRIEF